MTVKRTIGGLTFYNESVEERSLKFEVDDDTENTSASTSLDQDEVGELVTELKGWLSQGAKPK